MNDADRFVNIPEEMIFKSYLQRIIDHLTLVYDPAYSLNLSGVYVIDDEIPSLFHDGRDILAYARELMPENGEIKKLDYIPFLAFFAGFSLGSKGTVLNFSIPDGSEYVTPLTMTFAEQRYPNIHGITYLEQITSSYVPSLYRYSMLPLDLTGSLVRTYSKYGMAKALDFYLDSCNAILHRHWSFYYKDEPDFYKKTDLYCVWNMQTIQNDEIILEADSKNYGELMYGEFGWITDGTDDDGETIWKEKRMKLRLEIHSVSPFRYKYVVLCKTKSNRADYGDCQYDFSKYGIADQYSYSVIYESSDWQLGDHVWEYEFEPGTQPANAESWWRVSMYEPAVIIYPEYPDRLKEYCEELGVSV